MLYYSLCVPTNSRFRKQLELTILYNCYIYRNLLYILQSISTLNSLYSGLYNGSIIDWTKEVAKVDFVFMISLKQAGAQGLDCPAVHYTSCISSSIKGILAAIQQLRLEVYELGRDYEEFMRRNNSINLCNKLYIITCLIICIYSV